MGKKKLSLEKRMIGLDGEGQKRNSRQGEITTLCIGMGKNKNGSGPKGNSKDWREENGGNSIPTAIYGLIVILYTVIPLFSHTGRDPSWLTRQGNIVLNTDMPSSYNVHCNEQSCPGFFSFSLLRPKVRWLMKKMADYLGA